MTTRTNAATLKTRGKGEGSIYHRKSDGKWCASLIMPSGKPKVLYGKTRKDVAQKLHDAQQNVQNSLPVSSSRETVSTFMDQWLKTVAAGKVKQSTYERYRRDVELHIKPGIGGYRVNELTPEIVQKFLNELTISATPKGRGRQKKHPAPSPLGARGVAHCRAVLRVALGKAERSGLVGRNVAKLVDVPRQTQKQVRALAPEDARAILGAFGGHELEALVTLALATGLRQGEILGLRWDAVDLEARSIAVVRQLQRVRGAYELVELKTERSRRALSLPAFAVESLRAHRQRQNERHLLFGPAWQDTGLVFTTAMGGCLNGSAVTHRFQDQLKVAGIGQLTFHDLRHGAASLLLAQGADLRRIMEQLGHSQIALTANTYTHLIPALMRDNADKLELALRRTKQPSAS